MGSISNYIGSITRPSIGGSISDPAFGSITGQFDPRVLFNNDVAGFLDVPLVTDAAGVIGGAIGEIVNQANASPDLTQSTGTAKPTLGRLPQGGRRNQFLATATLATQNVTTRAVQYTMSFTGTGTITLTGTSTAGPLVGTGANDRVSLTFTPTAGTLTCTVSGSVTLAQIEYGAAATAYQAVGAVYDVTETGFPSIVAPYYDGGDYLDTGVQELSPTGDYFAEAGHAWSVGGAFSKLTLAGSTLFSKRESLTNADVTLHVFTNPTTGILTVNARGTETASGADLVDGDFHVWLLDWNGTALTLYVDQLAGAAIAVGTAAEEACNILVSARTPSSPGARYVGFNDVNLMLARSMSAGEIANYLAWANSYYRGV